MSEELTKIFREIGGLPEWEGDTISAEDLCKILESVIVDPMTPMWKIHLISRALSLICDISRDNDPDETDNEEINKFLESFKLKG